MNPCRRGSKWKTKDLRQIGHSLWHLKKKSRITPHPHQAKTKDHFIFSKGGHITMIYQ